jgi:hypothetical protein
VVSVPHVDVHLQDPVLRDPVDNLTLDRRIAGSAACFMISMVGNAMREEGIWDGDLLVVEPVADGRPRGWRPGGDPAARGDHGSPVPPGR